MLVTNSVVLNGGDAAIVKATIEGIERRLGTPVRATVLDRQSDVAARLFPNLNFDRWLWDVFFTRRHLFGSRRLRRFGRSLTRMRAHSAAFLLGRKIPLAPRLMLRRDEWRALRDYAAADLVVAKGGTYLVEHYQLAPHIFDFTICRLLRRPLVLGPQSLGPFEASGNRRAIRRVLGDAVVLVRDALSERHLEDIGDGRIDVRIAADTAFALADARALRTARSTGRTTSEGLRIAVSVREWTHFAGEASSGMERYVAALAELVAHLVREHGATVTFLSTCQGVPAYWTDDSAVAEEVVARLPSDVAASATVDSAFHTPEQLLAMLRRFDLSIATRMHFGILSLISGVPVLPIAYEFKTAQLFARLGMGDYVLDMSTIDANRAIEVVDRLVARLPSIRSGLFEAVDRERAAAERGVEVMVEALRARGEQTGSRPSVRA